MSDERLLCHFQLSFVAVFCILEFLFYYSLLVCFNIMLLFFPSVVLFVFQYVLCDCHFTSFWMLLNKHEWQTFCNVEQLCFFRVPCISLLFSAWKVTMDWITYCKCGTYFSADYNKSCLIVPWFFYLLLTPQSRKPKLPSFEWVVQFFMLA
jgi:hypothetical protein